MKRKIIAMALSIALGVSVFGGSAQAAVAQVASVSGCSHLHLSRDDKPRRIVDYEQASSIFHNIVYEVTYKCDDCGRTVPVYEREWEYCVFNKYENGRCYCSLCGMEDEDYRP